ncbi:MAG: ComF family protein [candidate division WOR-3 bacterium]
MTKITFKPIQFLINSIQDFIFPPQCLGCNKDIDEGFICKKCYTIVTTSALINCPICGLPYDHTEKCSHPTLKYNKSSPLKRIRVLGKYKMPYQNLIHHFKYQQKTEVGKLFGFALARLIISDPILSRARYLVPIPLHPARLRERGFNQSLLLSQEISLNTNLVVLDCLKRVKNTKSQTELNFALRVKNVENAFAIKPGFLEITKQSLIILVDDVITTTATISEASRVLQLNNAQEISAVAVAMAKT